MMADRSEYSTRFFSSQEWRAYRSRDIGPVTRPHCTPRQPARHRPARESCSVNDFNLTSNARGLRVFFGTRFDE